MKPIIASCLFFLLASCSSLKSKEALDLSLDKVLHLTPNQDNQETVTAALGKPDQQMRALDPDDQIWIYNDKKDGHQRLSLVFDKTNKLQSVLWLVRSRDPEIQLENSKKKFPTAQFTTQDTPSANSHASAAERLYTDSKNGISITFRKARQEVETIGWSNPNLLKNSEERKPAFKYEL